MTRRTLTDVDRHYPSTYLGTAVEVESLTSALRHLENEAELLSLLGLAEEAAQAKRLCRVVSNMLAQAKEDLDRRTRPIGSRLEARAKRVAS